MIEYSTEFEKMDIGQLEDFIECRYLEEQYAHQLRTEAQKVLRRKLSIMTAEEELELAQEKYARSMEELKPAKKSIWQQIKERLGIGWIN